MPSSCQSGKYLVVRVGNIVVRVGNIVVRVGI